MEEMIMFSAEKRVPDDKDGFKFSSKSRVLALARQTTTNCIRMHLSLHFT